MNNVQISKLSIGNRISNTIKTIEYRMKDKSRNTTYQESRNIDE